MKKTVIMLCLSMMMTLTASAKDIRIVEISTGNGMAATYDSSIQSILKTISGVSKVVSDVTNLVLTVTYDADLIGVDDIVGHINKQEPRFEARQKSEPKTKEWIKAEKKREEADKQREEADKKIEKEREEASKRDEKRQKQEAKEAKKEAQQNKR